MTAAFLCFESVFIPANRVAKRPSYFLSLSGSLIGAICSGKDTLTLSLTSLTAFCTICESLTYESLANEKFNGTLESDRFCNLLAYAAALIVDTSTIDELLADWSTAM